MNGQSLDLKALEKKAWRSTFEDGLFDAFLGATFVAMGLSMHLPNDNWYVVILFGLMLLFFVGKRFITVPRIGLVRFGPERRTKKLKVVVVLTLSVLVGLTLALVRGLGVGPEWLAQGQLGMAVIALAWFGTVFGAMAHFMEFRRLYYIGAVFSLGFVETILLDTSWLFTVGGAVVCAIGLAYLTHFVRKYRLTPERDPR